MDTEAEKCVMVINENLPKGIAANTAAIMGITLGKQIPEIVGKNVSTSAGNMHLGIVEIPVPVLKGDAAKIKELRAKLYDKNFSDVLTVDFTDLAQSCNIYDNFIYKMSKAAENDLEYLGIAICGPKKKVNKLTGNMPLLK